MLHKVYHLAEILVKDRIKMRNWLEESHMEIRRTVPVSSDVFVYSSALLQHLTQSRTVVSVNVQFDSSLFKMPSHNLVSSRRFT